MDTSTLYHLHLVSDSTGETVSSIVRSVMAHFEDIRHEEHVWPLVRTRGQMEKVLEGIRREPGIVLYTIMDEGLQAKLNAVCREEKVPCVPVLSRAMRELSAFFGVEATAGVGRQYELDEKYFERVEAINFTLAHDDGQGTEDLDKADIVLVGVSRTSKTPTCVYLSYKGLNVANIPYVKEHLLPENLFCLTKPLVVGLVIHPERLVQIRKSRLLSLNEERDTEYVDIEKVKEEVQEARRLFLKHRWPIIDVTRRSVEETAATIQQLYQEYKDRLESEGRA